MTFIVDCTASTICFAGERYNCQIGRNGPIKNSDKVEGDGCTPLGSWPIRGAIIRPDKGFNPPAELPWRWTHVSDGWCDDVSSECYNRPVRLPFAGLAEKLWRDDDLYDVVIPLGYNDQPVQEGRGSAIFLHLDGGSPTAGCVGVDAETMRTVLIGARLGMSVVVAT